MRRRSLLATLTGGVAALAGCSLSGSDPETVTPAPVPQEPQGEDGGPAGVMDDTTRERLSSGSLASLVDAETRSATYSVWPTHLTPREDLTLVLRFARTGTPEHPPIVHGYLQNTADAARTVTLDRLPAIGNTAAVPRNGANSARLLLAPTQAHDLAERVPDVSLGEDGRWRLGGVGRWVPVTHRLGPGEVLALEYALIWGPKTADPTPAIYEFEGGDTRLNVSVWDTDRPGPREPSSRTGLAVPHMYRHAKVQWYHRATAGTTLFVRPSPERAELDASITFDLVNHDREPLRCSHWTLYKLVDGEWFRVASTVVNEECGPLVPGDRRRWTFRAALDEAEPCDPAACGGRTVSRGYIGGGTYAVVASTGYPGGWTGAVFDLTGPPVSLAPTEDTRRQREGDVVVATTLRFGAPPPWTALAMTRASSADRRLIAEQVVGAGEFRTSQHGLATALALFESDVDRLVHWTDEPAVDRALGGPEAERRRFSFRGQAYEVSRVTRAQ